MNFLSVKCWSIWGHFLKVVLCLMRAVVISLLSHCTSPAEWDTSLEMAIFKPQLIPGWWKSSAPTSHCLCGTDPQQTNPNPSKNQIKSRFSCYQLFLSVVAVYWCSQGENQSTAGAVCEIEGGNKDRKKRAANTANTKALDARITKTSPEQQTLPAEISLFSDVVVNLVWISFQSKSSAAWLSPGLCFSTLPTPPPAR